MTYWIIEYLVTDPGGAQRREYVHCAYMRDMEEAEVQRVAPPRVR